MEICFYTDRTLFQIYNGYLKRKFYAANIANKVTPLILINRGAYAVFGLLGKQSRINNRMNLAIVSKSALTSLRRRCNPDRHSPRLPGPPPSRGALRAPRSHTSKFTVDIGRQSGLERKDTHQKSQTGSRNKPKKPEGRRTRQAAADAERPGESGRSWAHLVSFLR